jgi:hypothetical protein
MSEHVPHVPGFRNERSPGPPLRGRERVRFQDQLKERVPRERNRLPIPETRSPNDEDQDLCPLWSPRGRGSG